MIKSNKEKETHYMNRLKQLRKEKGHTLESLKNVLENRGVKVSTGQLSSYENGNRSPRDNEIWNQLADYFEVNVGYLLGYEDSPIKELDAFIRDPNDSLIAMKDYIIQTFDYLDSKEKELLYSIVRVFRNQKEYYDKIENKEK